jgi:hypothetical protein
MPKRAEPKSGVVFRVAKPRERPYLLTDGNGLALRVWTDGSKRWLLRYRCPGTGRENFLSLGAYPEIALTEARKSAAIARSLVREGTDPVEHRRAEDRTAFRYRCAASSRATRKATSLQLKSPPKSPHSCRPSMPRTDFVACCEPLGGSGSAPTLMSLKHNSHTPNEATCRRPTTERRLTKTVAA